MDKNQIKAVNEFLAGTEHTINHEGQSWVVRTSKGNLSKHFAPSQTKEWAYRNMFNKLVEINVIKEVAK